MYKTRRRARYERLRDSGFTNFEARGLSRVSPRVPYMLPLMKERLAEYTRAIERAKRQEIAEADFNKQWLTHIKRRYIMKGWRHKGDPWGVTVTYRMLKDKEKEYKYKHPDYTSPWVKRQKAWRDFIGKLEATYSKYPAGKIYGKRKAPIKLRYLPEGGVIEE